MPRNVGRLCSQTLEDLKEGEYVLASDPETGDLRARQITDTRDHSGVKHLVTLAVDPDGKDGDAKPGKITATDEHPFWLPDFGRWADAEDLEPGMWLQTSAGTWVQITAIDDTHRTQRVHNLTVGGPHTYFVAVGSAAVLVHNDEPTEVCKTDAGKASYQRLKDAVAQAATRPASVVKSRLSAGQIAAGKKKPFLKRMFIGSDIEKAAANNPSVLADPNIRHMGTSAPGQSVPDFTIAGWGQRRERRCHRW
ncbi:polymorphic toxin-type HINT domain-containing protein [Streptomyces sp. GD-15H]|uniref:polymorphic toxin-type HINT domain-containing protein n=1 Tax=Streptomyces sp. GD-15H TaxID=3129112 RepID=UPI003246DD84